MRMSLLFIVLENLFLLLLLVVGVGDGGMNKLSNCLFINERYQCAVSVNVHRAWKNDDGARETTFEFSVWNMLMQIWLGLQRSGQKFVDGGVGCEGGSRKWKGIIPATNKLWTYVYAMLSSGYLFDGFAGAFRMFICACIIWHMGLCVSLHLNSLMSFHFMSFCV